MPNLMKPGHSKDPAVLDPAVAADRSFIDFPHEHSITKQLTLKFVILVFAVTFGGLLGLQFFAPWFPARTWFLGLALYVVLFVRLRRERTRFLTRSCRIFAENREEPIPVLLDRLFPNGEPAGAWNLRPLAKELVRRGRLGVSCRIRMPGTPSTVVPIDQVFEAVALDESDPHFVELEREGLASPSMDQQTTFGADRDDLVRKSRRNIHLSGGWVVAGLFGFVTLIQATKCWDAGSIDIRLVLFAVIFGTILFGPFGRGAWSALRKWTLIPGGVAVAHSGIFNAKTSLAMFRRNETILFVRQAGRHFWAALVANKTTSRSVTVTEREAAMLFRTWLSTAPTPSDEQIAQLVGAELPGTGQESTAL